MIGRPRAMPKRGGLSNTDKSTLQKKKEKRKEGEKENERGKKARVRERRQGESMEHPGFW